MEKFTLEALAHDLEDAKQNGGDAQAEVERRLKRAIDAHGPETVIEALEAAIPEGASLGELIVYRSAELTMLYGRIPPRFRSGIHDHTVFACIAQLTGVETSVVYEPVDEGEGLRVAETMSAGPGQVTCLPADAIHHIENPTDEVARALHVYAGDFSAIENERSLWSHDEHVRGSFSLQKLLHSSLVAMKKTGNDAGVRGIVKAFPAAQAMVDAL